MKKEIMMTCVAGALALVILPGCNPQDAHNLAADTNNIAKDAGRSLGNAGLDSKVGLVLTNWKGVDMSGLHIDVSGGDVTISGHVRNRNEKNTIVNCVNHIRGVNSVHTDNLTVQSQ